MCLVNDEPGDFPPQQQAFDGFRTQGFRRNVEQRGRAVLRAFEGFGAIDRVEHAVNGDRLGDARAFQIIHLVFH